MLNKYHGAFASDSAVQTAISNDSDLSLEQGDLYFNTTQSALRYYDGSAWYNAASTSVIDTSNLVNVGDVSYDSSIAANDLLVRTANGWTNTTFADLMASLNAEVFTSTDHIKLDGIEAGATADQTGAEIKTAYEGEADTNAFTDTLKTKLEGIEAGATGDLTGAEIKTAYEGEADTNAFTNELKGKLEGIEAGADVTDSGNVQAAGALMESELFSESAVKGINQALTTTSDVTFDSVSDTVSNVRTPRYTSLTGTTATISDEGVYYTTSVTSCTLGSPVAGTVMTIYNNGASDITLYKGSTLQTMRIGADNDGSNGGNKGSVTLAPNSTTTITMFLSDFAVVTGTGVS